MFVCLFASLSHRGPARIGIPASGLIFPLGRPPAQNGIIASTAGVTISGHDCLSLHLNYVKTSGLDLHASWQSVVAQAVEESIRFLLSGSVSQE